MCVRSMSGLVRRGLGCVQVNQTTAKASLTQMLNVVFQRMELGTETAHVPPIMVSDVLGLPSTDSSSMSAFVQSFLHDVGTPSAFRLFNPLVCFPSRISCWTFVNRHPFVRDAVTPKIDPLGSSRLCGN